MAQATQDRHERPRSPALVLGLIVLGITLVATTALTGRDGKGTHSTAGERGAESDASLSRPASGQPSTHSTGRSPSTNRAGAPQPVPAIIAEDASSASNRRAAPPPAGFSDEDYAKSRVDIFREFYRAAETWSLDDYLRQRARRDTMDGETAYQVYVFLRTCLDTPRSAESAEARIEGLRRSAEQRPADFADVSVDRLVENVERGLARCEGLDSIEGLLEPVLLDWLTLAADRAYPQAQLAYYQSARWLLQRQPALIYRQPDILRRYHTQARAYLEAALATGHTEAFTELSMAYMEGIVVERDAALAYAYAHAADMAAHGQNAMARRYLAVMEPELDADGLREARAHGRSLCEAHCR